MVHLSLLFPAQRTLLDLNLCGRAFFPFISPFAFLSFPFALPRSLPPSIMPLFCFLFSPNFPPLSPLFLSLAVYYFGRAPPQLLCSGRRQV